MSAPEADSQLRDSLFVQPIRHAVDPFGELLPLTDNRLQMIKYPVESRILLVATINEPLILLQLSARDLELSIRFSALQLVIVGVAK